jgi:hypothetical protein
MKGGGGFEPEWKVRRVTVHTAGWKIPTGQNVHISSLYVNSDKHLPQSPFTGQFFYLTKFCFGVFKVN